jgi:O-antigen/teichoic acid export membrane protein
VIVPASEDTRRLDTGHHITVARNVAARYLVIVIESLLGFVMLPFNMRHLGSDAYGLWILIGSVVVHFSVLDLGFGGALVKFVAEYRARRDAQALNEIASTMFVVFGLLGLVAYAAAVAVALNLGHVFHVTPEQAAVGKWLLLIIGLNVAANFPFSVYGAVINGFQRYDANSFVAIACSVAVAIVNVLVLSAGFGLITLVACTTSVRIGAYFVYRLNAYRIFPPLRVTPSLFRQSRLREATGFSIYASIIDWANRLNYQLDELVIGATLGSAPIVVWAVADRIAMATQRLTNQLNGVLFPVVVDFDTTRRSQPLQRLLLEGTRLSLAMVIPITVAIILLARPLVRAWVGPKLLDAVPLVQLLILTIAIRVGNATGTTLLKGAGQVRYVAFVNVGAGLVNLVLSLLLVKPFGLVGVAIGTLLPVATASILLLFPAACRRVDVSVGHAFRHAVWPATWPALAIGGVLFLTRQAAPDRLLSVLLQAAAADLLYLALFFLIAVGAPDRRRYRDQLTQIITRRGRLVPVTWTTNGT